MRASVKIFRDTYVDSVVQLRGMRVMRELEGVEWASAAMATPANVETLRAEGVDDADVEGAGSNDFFLVARASSDVIASKALAAGESAVFSSGQPDDGRGGAQAARSLPESSAMPQTRKAARMAARPVAPTPAKSVVPGPRSRAAANGAAD